VSAETLCVVIGAALAGFVQGLSGFAFGLAAMPIWVWYVAPQQIGPMIVFGSAICTLLTIRAARGGFDWRLIWPFIVAGATGVPIGVYVLHFLDPTVFKLAVGLLLVVYCPILLFSRRLPHITGGGRAADGTIGFVGGVMGGIAGLTGPVPILWCMVRGWTPVTQRAVFQSFNVVMQMLALGMYGASGILTADVGRKFALVLPAMLGPGLIGARLYHRIDPIAFRRIVLMLLIVSGAVMLAAAIPALLR
jgi:uncharacterized membrane protein YfcA